MGVNNDIRKSINEIVNSQQKAKNILFMGEVIEQNFDENTFTIRNIKGDGDEVIEGIYCSMGESVNTGGIKYQTMPGLNTQVIVFKNVDDNSFYLVKFDELLKYVVKTTSDDGSDSIVMESSNFTVSGLDRVILDSKNSIILGSENIFIKSHNALYLAGKSDDSEVNFGGLVKVEDLVTRLNLLENQFNLLYAAYVAHTGHSTGVQPPPIPGGAVINPITSRSDIENPDIIQFGSE